MDLQTMLGPVPCSTFISEYFHRLPYVVANRAASLIALGSWQSLVEILLGPAADVLVVSNGEQLPCSAPQSADAAKELIAGGASIVVRHAEQTYKPLELLANAFRRDFAAPINVHLHATPSGQRGFPWHYDAEDVFIVQTQGCKEYSLRKNTVQPWPLEETLPADMQYRREIMPLMRATLSAGDWLYIPCGYWHQADATASRELSMSLAIGVMSPAAIAVHDFVRQRLVNSLVWRQRMPVRGVVSPLDAEEALARHREIFQQLAADLTAILRDDGTIRGFLDCQLDV